VSGAISPLDGYFRVACQVPLKWMSPPQVVVENVPDIEFFVHVPV
jgi:hypothetical protein